MKYFLFKNNFVLGVVTLYGKLYCVGGCEGQRSIATCEVYDPTLNKWSRIASLNIGKPKHV